MYSQTSKVDTTKAHSKLAESTLHPIMDTALNSIHWMPIPRILITVALLTLNRV